ncbi:MAG: hypothetical protein M1818_008514 [Claussenomyces sp. TS43310]|nr:MAG: hypothetical protein M1818_008514 [Claussenomyces sp. TS43310]
MAHLIRLSALTDELVTILTSYSAENESGRFRVHRDSALRSLRHHNLARTNQFDVERRLEGLEEKFRIYCEDHLADALGQRLHELNERSTRWTPEILHLLLELSDQPVAKLPFHNLNFLRPPEVHVEPVLKWADLVAEDPLLREEDVWRNVDFTAESSDDDDRESVASMRDFSELTESTVLSSVNDDLLRRLEDFSIPSDSAGLDLLQKTQFWVDKDRKDDLKARFEIFPEKITFITELQALREILFMVSGLPTFLFRAVRGQFIVSKEWRLRHLSSAAFHELLSAFAVHGTIVMGLRLWCMKKQSIPLLQSFQDQISARIRQVDKTLSNMQRRFVALSQNVVVSLIEIKAKLDVVLRPFERLSEIIKILEVDPYAHTFRYLEFLYDETCISQVAGDDELYEFLGTIFLDCFQVYLSPVRKWMEEGELQNKDNVFFITEVPGKVDTALLWKDRYKLRKTPDGTLHGPRFLHTAANKIFTTGKSVVVLKQLRRAERLRQSNAATEPKLDFSTISQTILQVDGGFPHSAERSLAPFSELFDIALEKWLQSKHRTASSRLHQYLFDECGLISSLVALKNIYFMADGSTSSILTNSVFDRLSNGVETWNDSFGLTELAQNTIGSLVGVEAERLRISIGANKRYNSVQKARRTVKALSTIVIHYHRPWPVQIVVPESSMVRYQAIFTLLLQIRRSSHILEGVQILHDPANVDSSADERAIYYSLRSRLLWFSSTFYNYLTDLVICPNTARMQADLARTEDVDQMIQVHDIYIKSMIEQALLGTRLEPIHKAIVSILDLSIQLSDAYTLHLSSSEHRSTQSVVGRSARLSRQRRFRGSNTSDSEDADADHVTDLSILAVSEMAYIDDLRGMRRQFDHLCKFVTSGLRGVARAGGRPEWDMLAEKFETGIRGTS